MEYVKYLYTGGLLSIAKQCIALRANDEFCQQIWVRRNLYMDDIFAFTLALRYFREYRGLEIGWFYSGCGAHCASCQHRLRAGSKDLYAFPHVCTGPDYVTTFDLTRYVFHRVGSGYYSQMFRESFRDRPLHERSWRYVDAELEFSDKQKFNNTLEFRFLGENSTTLKDELWSCRTLKLRRDDSCGQLTNHSLMHASQQLQILLRNVFEVEFGSSWRCRNKWSHVQVVHTWKVDRLDPKPYIDFLKNHSFFTPLPSAVPGSNGAVYCFILLHF